MPSEEWPTMSRRAARSFSAARYSSSLTRAAAPWLARVSRFSVSSPVKSVSTRGPKAAANPTTRPSASMGTMRKRGQQATRGQASAPLRHQRLGGDEQGGDDQAVGDAGGPVGGGHRGRPQPALHEPLAGGEADHGGDQGGGGQVEDGA